MNLNLSTKCPVKCIVQWILLDSFDWTGPGESKLQIRKYLIGSHANYLLHQSPLHIEDFTLNVWYIRLSETRNQINVIFPSHPCPFWARCEMQSWKLGGINSCITLNMSVISCTSVACWMSAYFSRDGHKIKINRFGRKLMGLQQISLSWQLE